jgi:hypothetical protein
VRGERWTVERCRNGFPNEPLRVDTDDAGWRGKRRDAAFE